MDIAAPGRTLNVACPHCHTANRVPAHRLGDAPKCGTCSQPLFGAHPVELSEADFERHVACSDLPVVVDFWAPWCGPCRAMAPQFEQAAAQLRGQALLVKVNSDDNPAAAARFGIRSIPTLVRLERGREVARQSGALPAAQIVRFAS